MAESVIWSRINPHTKAEAVKIFKHMVLTLSQAIRLFINQTITEQKLPFSIKVPNTATRKALQSANLNHNLEKTSLEQLKKDWHAACDK